MHFNSFTFLVFFAVTFALLQAAADDSRRPGRLLTLIEASNSRR